MLKKTILFALLSTTPLISLAQNWVPVAYGSTVTLYVDPKTIKKFGDVRKVWVLHDKSVKDALGDHSSKVYKEYHCAEDKYRLLQIDGYNGRMGDGRPTGSESGDGVWKYISPNTLESGVLDFVCKK